MEIRRATSADAGVLRRFWEASSAEIDFTPYPGAAFDESLLAEHVALVAEDAGEPIGAVYANLGAEHFGYVYGLYVLPGARRRGVARALMRAIAAALRDEGRDYVLLNVDTPNAAARELYERLGFVDASRLLRARVGDLLRGD
jgi:ribosomal protein S18 acetylase RimI-like enzyme